MGNIRLNKSLSNGLNSCACYSLSLAISLILSGTAKAATFTVTNNLNSGAGSLRQAVLNANATVGTDNIDFSIASGEKTIILSGSELLITDSLTVTGPTTGDPASITINGNASSRVINATIPANGALTLNNLTLKNGVVNGQGGGLKVAGASSASSFLTLNDTVITGNSTSASGSYHEGGGLYVSNANITLNNSTISNNKTEAIKSPGGGVFVNEVVITFNNSTLSGNHTSGSQSSGGGFYADGATTLNNSTVSGNWTSGSNSSGGGLYIFLDEPQNQSASIYQSTISGNSTSGSSAHGGGIAVFKGDAIIKQSTITNNISSGASAAGGGLFALVEGHSVFLNNTILSGNTGFLGNLFGASPTTGKINSSNSFFGDSSTEVTGTNTTNIFSNAPSLGVLQDNGGVTLTHEPNTASPVLDAGNNSLAPFAEDQRGAGFTRIYNTNIDIGSVEKQPIILVPQAATLLTPIGSISDTTPTYSWNAVANSSSYYLWVNDSMGSKIRKWYSASQASCASGTGTCSITPAIALANGEGNWRVQTWNNNGYGPWSASDVFTVEASNPPAVATLVSPTGSISDTTPTYSWNAVANSSWYYLWVDDSTGNKIKKWYTASQANCDSNTCSVTPTTVLSNGNGQWWIQTWNSNGAGPWSSGNNFDVNNNEPPPSTTPVSPTGIITDTTPTYTWNAVSNATWYYLWVDDASGNKIKKWYTASQANCNGNTCSVTPTTVLSNGNVQWWVQTWNFNGKGPWSSSLGFTITP